MIEIVSGDDERSGYPVGNLQSERDRSKTIVQGFGDYSSLLLPAKEDSNRLQLQLIRSSLILHIRVDLLRREPFYCGRIMRLRIAIPHLELQRTWVTHFKDKPS